WAGPEIAVASTKAYTTQVVSLYMIALNFALEMNTIDIEEYKKVIKEMLDLPEEIEKVLQSNDLVKEIAEEIKEKQHIFYLGRAIDYCLALEGSLKLK